MEYLDKVVSILGLDQFDDDGILRIIQGWTKGYLKPGYTLLLLLILGLMFLFTPLGFAIFYHLIAFAYPSYVSYKAIKSEDNSDDLRMLTYWIVFGFMHAFESTIEYFLYFIPGFAVVRLFLMIYIFHPKLGGASHTYRFILEPILGSYEERIDAIVGKIGLIVDDVQMTSSQLLSSVTNKKKTQ